MCFLSPLALLCGFAAIVVCVVVDAGGGVGVLMSWVAVLIGVVVAGCVRCCCCVVLIVDIGGGMAMVLIVFLVAGFVACMCC